MGFATSLLAECTGDNPCFYCGNPASEPLKLSSSFMGWADAAYPRSLFLCNGCIWMTNEKRSIPGKEKPQKTRNYSWLVTSSEQAPYTKAHKNKLLEIMLTPPDEPWSLCLADSGNKHLLWRTPVNYSSPYAVRLEEETIEYTPLQLGDRYELAKRVVAVIGHKGAVNPSINLALSGSVELATKWNQVLQEPLTRLALFVCPSMEICKSEYQDA